MYVGDVIRNTDSFRETVTEVSFDGSFYTETEMTGLYVDEETDLDFFDEETMYDDNCKCYRLFHIFYGLLQ